MQRRHFSLALAFAPAAAMLAPPVHAGGLASLSNAEASRGLKDDESRRVRR